MFRTLLLGTVAAVALSGAASAADLPIRTAAPAPVYAAPMFSWTGFYVGVNAGGAWNNSRWASPTNAFLSFNTNGSGFIGGVHAGYNQQFGSLVAGIEADGSFVSVKGTGQCSNVVGTTCYTKQDLSASLRGRLGVAFDRTLVYATGGLAYSEFKSGQSVALVQNWGKREPFGWVVGLGAEYALTNNWILGAEWKYYDFGKKTVTVAANGPATVRYSETENTFVARLSYKFGGPSAIVAKY